MPSITKILQHGSVLLTSGSRWVFEVGLVTPALVRSVTLFVGDSGFCKLDHLANGDWQVIASSKRSAPFAATFPPTIRFRLTPTGPLGAQFVACSIPGVIDTLDNLLELQYPLSPKLVTTYDGPQFRYIDLIGE